MIRRVLRLVAAFSSCALVAGCEAAKSSSPTSPSVAGPIPGVVITAPRLIEPAQGWEIDKDKQPITLIVENASSNGARPLRYRFEVATDAAFTNKVFTRENVSPGQGRTSLKLSDPLETGRTYYWRAQADDGANTGPFASPVFFNVITPIIIDPPVPLYPVGGATVTSTRPEFAARNSNRSGPVGQLHYTFEISANDSFSSMIAVVTIAEQPNETKFTIAQDLAPERPIFWRVRAYDPSADSTWSQLQSFRVAAPPSPPAPSPSPGGPPPAGSYPTNGPEVIQYVSQKYPQYQVCCVSASQRVANMEFLRDRVIETALCAGMKVAWNQKRGVGPRSIDAIAQNINGSIEVIDIGAAYDDTSQSLHLQWVLVPGPPGWDPYPSGFKCP